MILDNISKDEGINIEIEAKYQNVEYKLDLNDIPVPLTVDTTIFDIFLSQLGVNKIEFIIQLDTCELSSLLMIEAVGFDSKN